MIEFLKSKTFFIHIALAVLLMILVLSGTYYWLGAYTKHGETIVVPDIKGRQWLNLEKELADKNLRLKIADSSVFIVDRPGGMIVEQDPAPGSRVKENRTIYITVTRIVPPQVKMPAIIDVSDRQAEAILMSYGLKTGILTYKPDLARNAVLEMLWNGKSLQPGDEVPKGSTIDLVLGDGLGNTEVEIPRLISLTYEEAIYALKMMSLSPGAVIFDDDIKDTLEAVIYKQVPAPGDTARLKQGQSIDLYLKKGNL